MRKIISFILINIIAITLVGCNFFSEEPLTHTVTFTGNFIGVIEAIEVEDGKSILLPEVSATDPFLGWFDENDPTSQFTSFSPVFRDVTLEARFAEPRTLDISILEYETAIVDMIESVRTSVLGISNIQGGVPASSGSGVIYKRIGNTYYVVTNHHVLEDFEEIEIIYERNDLIFTISNDAIDFMGSDPGTDLGVLTFESEIDFAVVEFGEYYDLKIGQYVYAVGSPLGFTYFNSVTQGIISGLSRFFVQNASLGGFEGFVIQHDAAINPGNSGGALFTSSGKFIGINTFKIDRSADQRNLEGLGFAVPSSTISRVIRDIEEFGEIRRPFFGISSDVRLSGCDQDFGVCVQTVVPDSSAEALDIQVGDVIIGFQNDTMEDMVTTNNFEQLREAILNSRVGQLARVKLIRDGETIVTEYVALVIHPDDR